MLKSTYIITFNWYLLSCCFLQAAEHVPSTNAVTNAVRDQVEFKADVMEYRNNNKYLIGKGNVFVRVGGRSLSADFVQLDTETMNCYARGNVVVAEGGETGTGLEGSYNFLTGQLDLPQGMTYRQDNTNSVYIMTNERTEQISTNKYKAYKVMVTTCDQEKKEFKMKAATATVKDRRYVTAWNVVPYLGPVPFFYLPLIKFDLQDEESPWEIVPGYKGSWGAFLLVAYRMRLNDTFKSKTHLDYRLDRGIAVGQDFFWDTPDETATGEIKTYYAWDDRPFRNEEEEAEFGDTVDSERYRVRLKHNQALTDRTALIADFHYLSDPKVIEDFFEREFREQSQPENRIALSYRGDNFSSGLLLNKRLNDFYENVDRVPELNLSVPSYHIGDSRFYYDSQNYLSRLERVYPDGSGREDYEVTRFFTEHKVSHVKKYFGFLNIIPSLGYRGTYYSALKPETIQITNIVTVVDTNGVETTEEQVVSQSGSEGDAELRNLYDFKVETSFKAYKLIHNEERGYGTGLRHIVEPYAIYQYTPEPNIEPHELYQFDEIDTYDMEHNVTFGWRNRWQTKRMLRLTDMVNIDMYTLYRIEKQEAEDDFGPLTIDAELLPSDHFRLDFELDMDWYGEGLLEFDSQLWYAWHNDSKIYADYGYRKDSKSLASFAIDYFPVQKWGVKAYVRNDFDEGRVEEHYYVLQHKMDCIGWETGLRFKPGYEDYEDDNALWFRIWLLAFPDRDFQILDISPTG